MCSKRFTSTRLEPGPPPSTHSSVGVEPGLDTGGSSAVGSDGATNRPLGVDINNSLGAVILGDRDLT